MRGVVTKKARPESSKPVTVEIKNITRHSAIVWSAEISISNKKTPVQLVLGILPGAYVVKLRITFTDTYNRLYQQSSILPLSKRDVRLVAEILHPLFEDWPILLELLTVGSWRDPGNYRNNIAAIAACFEQLHKNASAELV